MLSVGCGDAADDAASVSSGTMTKDAAVEKLMELFGENIVDQLTSAQWKERLETVGDVLSKAKELDIRAHGSTLIQGIAHVPGWAEKNFQVWRGEGALPLVGWALPVAGLL